MDVKKLMAGAACIAAMTATAAVHAAPITVSSVTASGTFSSYNVNNLINGSGLSGGLHSGLYTGKWLTNGTVTGSLVFDLGAVFDVTNSSIWNYGNGCCGAGRSVKNLAVEGSLDGVTYFDVGSFILTQPVGDPFAAESIALNETARYFRFNLQSNYGDSYTGLSEVQFNGSEAAVPEPATLALVALGLIGFAARRRTSSN